MHSLHAVNTALAGPGLSPEMGLEFLILIGYLTQFIISEFMCICVFMYAYAFVYIHTWRFVCVWL